jgi:predicted XRE-type DNA-binding protein/predicted DNA-binding protein YlxM (UPF0122 family)
MENEIWKDIPEFDGYKCSSLGNIMSFKNDNNGKLLKQKANAYGYLSVTLKGNDKKAYRRNVHRIVATLFIDNPNNYPIVNHKNNIKTDNNSSNLEWCTTAENTQYYFDTSESIKKDKQIIIRVTFTEEELANEEWRDIDGFPNYKCSNLGRIKSGKEQRERIIEIKPNIGGYFRVTLTDANGNHLSRMIHRIVAKAFIPNPDNYPIVHHKNNIKTDNRITNLEWCPASVNVKHGFDEHHRKVDYGENHSNAKINKNQAMKVISLMEENKLTQTEISDKTGVSIPTIKQIKAKKNWKHIENNISDKRYSKLSPTQILEIHKLGNSGEFTLQEIADKYNICADTVHNIKCGIEWSEITGQKYEKNDHTNSKLTENDVLNIYKDSWNGELTEVEICNKYNVSSATVNRIKNGRVWNSITGHKKNTEKLPTHLCTTLSKDDVLNIYDLSWNSDLTQIEIGKKYNIKQSTVNDIKTGRTWSKITGHKKSVE